MTQEYKSNSHASKSKPEICEKKKIEKVTTGVTKTKKKSGSSGFASIFLAEDVTNVKSYILEEVLLPAAKKAISDIVTNGVDMLLYGEVKPKGKEKGSKVSYSGYYKDRDHRDVSRNRTRKGYDYEEIIFESRGDAESVLDSMFELLDNYDVVSIGDYYDLSGKTGNYIDNKYGWTGLRNADVQRTREGYVINLPRVVEI
ncbi:MAG: hypothetical protein ACRCTZ_09410 [Sarcina sp.]